MSSTEWTCHFDRFNISRHSGIPLYYQIKEVIRRVIVEGYISEGNILPSENDLSDYFGVSRQVARRALSELSLEGLIESKKGVGSFVSHRLTPQLTFVGSFTENIKEASPRGYTKVIQQGVKKPDIAISNALKIDSDEDVFYIQRVGYIDDKPVAVTSAYFIMDVGEVFLGKDLNDQSLYKILKKTGKAIPSRGEKILSVVPASFELAAILDVRESLPLISKAGVTFDEHNRPFEYMDVFYRSDRVVFKVTSF